MWAQLLSAMLGIWLMVAPNVLGYADGAATNDHIIGPMVTSFGMIAFGEITRSFRYLNRGIGVWLLVAPWVLGYQLTLSINSIAVGLALAALSFVRGKAKHFYGGGWKSLWKNSALPKPDGREYATSNSTYE